MDRAAVLCVPVQCVSAFSSRLAVAVTETKERSRRRAPLPRSTTNTRETGCRKSDAELVMSFGHGHTHAHRVLKGFVWKKKKTETNGEKKRVVGPPKSG
uniref:Putative secreted protein n=1 Tax=Anopheles darlingi TaxID=43151 RepID=A0A2M4DH85_ANODA